MVWSGSIRRFGWYTITGSSKSISIVSTVVTIQRFRVVDTYLIICEWKILPAKVFVSGAIWLKKTRSFVTVSRLTTKDNSLKSKIKYWSMFSKCGAFYILKHDFHQSKVFYCLLVKNIAYRKIIWSTGEMLE
jgi:hypothetical protein